MVWNLTSKPHRVFPRNPLAAVIVDLRYHPILKVASKVPDFQESVRGVFPDFAEQPHQFVTFQPFGGIQVAQDRVFSFRKGDGSATLSLSTSSLTLDSRRHEKREQLIDEVCLAIDALLKLYAPVSPSRLGLRYINVIDREHMSRDLDRELTWRDLITERFLGVPSELADWSGTTYNVEVSSPMAEGGLTLRYGLLDDPKDRRNKFRFDSDRYIEAPFEPSRAREFLARFADDIYSIFIEAMGQALEEWMEKSEHD